LELLVVLVVLGVLLAVVGVAGVVTTAPTSSHLGIRIRAVGNRTDITEVDSAVAVSSLTRAASTGLVLRDSAGVLVLGERR
jgi:hypothetical protein